MGISIRYDKNAVERRVRSSLKKNKTKKEPKKKTKKTRSRGKKKAAFLTAPLLRQQTDLPV